MSIKMIGIDYNNATIDERSVFALTKGKSVEVMGRIISLNGITGSVIISTCNRLEIWVSTHEDCDIDISSGIFDVLCSVKGVSPKEFKNIFVMRENEEAVEHLFLLASGLKSQILGEDQIITQIKDALLLSRENGFARSTLEVLFRTAITAGKKVKTNVVLSTRHTSSVDEVMTLSKNIFSELDNISAMVVGNGVMGKLMAEALLKEGAKVFVTVRQQYKHGKIPVPKGAVEISYDEREFYIPMCQLVVSATSSPHLTLTKEMFDTGKNIIAVDLAVPRDIDVKCKELENVTLYDIDDFKAGKGEINEAKEKAKSIIDEEIEIFYQWQKGTPLTGKIQFIKEETAQDVNVRLRKAIRKMDIEESLCIELENRIDIATQSMMNRMLFQLKNTLTHQEFTKCIEGIEKIYE